MTREEAFEHFKRLRDEADRKAYLADCAAIRARQEQAEDAVHLGRLFAIFEREGAAYVSRRLDEISDRFPDGFVRRHVEIMAEGLPFQRVYLRANLAEAA